MRRSSLRFLLLWGSLLAAPSFGCAVGAEPIAEDTAPLIGGTKDTGDPAAVMIFVQNATQAAACSGTVVSPHVVLTAAHCVSPEVVDGAVTPPYDFYVFLGDDLNSSAQLSDPNNLPRVETTAFDPLFATTPNDPAGATHDVGVVILKDAVSVPPMPMNRTPLGPEWVGKSVRIVGYGQSKAGDWASGDVKKQGTAAIVSIDAEHLSVSDDEAHFCGGDSGGPTLIVRNGVESVAGVHSWVEEVSSCTGHQYDIRVDASAAFIDPFIAKYDPGFVLPGDGSANEGGSGGSGGAGSGGADGGSDPGTMAEGSGCAMHPSPAPSLMGVALSLFGLAALTRARRKPSRRASSGRRG
ncbi:Vitamin K-dependent protein C [Minicystis rosea]|nr:Vitamin K-dependent protein C [Minicystis rosea]